MISQNDNECVDLSIKEEKDVKEEKDEKAAVNIKSNSKLDIFAKNSRATTNKRKSSSRK